MKITDEFTWWLGKKNSFTIEGEYQIDLIWIDKKNNSAKIKITNLKTKEIIETTTDMGVSNDN